MRENVDVLLVRLPLLDEEEFHNQGDGSFGFGPLGFMAWQIRASYI